MPDPIETYQNKVDLMVQIWPPALKKMYDRLRAEDFSEDNAIILLEALLASYPNLVPNAQIPTQ